MSELVYLELLLRKKDDKFENMVRINENVSNSVTEDEYNKIVKKASELSMYISKAMRKNKKL